ncbi:MAG: response regulator transcription factor [Clostridia bacterium]|nr:response regulator transcription factor [Clostridia bacterium]
MKILICDDEKIYAQHLEKEIREFLTNEGCDTEIDLFFGSDFVNGEIKEYDIAFLDIEMAPYNGIETARALKEKNPKIILFFITAYNSYLDDALDINAFRYLSKPLDTDRLFNGLKKALDKIDLSDKQFAVVDKEKNTLIKASDIIMVEIVGKSTVIHTLKGAYHSKENISYWAENLTEPIFFRTHKSFIVNSNFITDYSKDFVYLINDILAPVSYRKQAEFKKFVLSLLERR